MRLCLSFSHHPFAGVVCDNCGAGFNPCDGIKRGLFTGHRRAQHGDNHDLDVTLQVEKVFTQGSTLAELHHSLPQDSDRLDLYLKYWSDDYHSIFWCTKAECNTGFFKKDSHRAHRAHLVRVNARRLLGVKNAKVFLRETHQTLNELTRLFSISYKDALASPRIQAAAAANTRTAARQVALNALRAQAVLALPANLLPAAAADTTTANTSLAPFAPLIPFKRFSIPECLANAIPGLLDFLPRYHCHASRMFELWALAAGDGGHIILLRFLRDSGLVGLANRHFGGNFYAMVDYLIAGRSLPNLTKVWERKLHKAAGEMFWKAVKLVPSMSIESRQKIMRIGDGEHGSLVSKIKGLVESAASELSAVTRHDADDNADNDGIDFAGNRDEWSLTQGKALLVQLTELVDSTSASGQKRKLDPLGGETLNRYCATFQRFILFVARFADAQQDDAGCWWRSTALPSLQNGNDDVAIAVALKLVIASLRLDEQGSYATLVEPATSIPALFILAETVQQSSDNPMIGVAEEDALADYPIIRSASPYNMHQACSRVMYGMRVTYLAGMVQAHLWNDLVLQSFLPRAEVFSTCQAVLEIGNLARVAKSYEAEVQTGNPSPIPIVNSDGVTEEWTVQHKSKGMTYRVKKDQIALAIRRSFDDAEDAFSEIITSLFSEFDEDDKKIVAAGLGLEDAWTSEEISKELIKAMFTGPLEFKEAGPNGFKCHETFVETTDRHGTPFNEEIYASTIGATLQFREKSLCCGTLANILAQVLVKACVAGEKEFVERFDSLAENILIGILTLMTMTGRGNPRTADLSGSRCGVTNAFSIEETQLDIFVGTSGETKLSCLLIRYRSWKYKNGSGSFSDCPVLWLPEELTRQLGLYLSIIRTAQVRALSCLAALSGGEEEWVAEFEFGHGHKEQDPFVSESIVHPMIFAACTRLAFKICLAGDKLICKQYSGFDKKVQMKREFNLGLVEGSMPCSIWRLLEAAISSVIFASTINVSTNSLVAQAFGHTSTIHDNIYLKTSSLETGGAKISQPMIEQGLLLDTMAHIFKGIAGEGNRNGNTVWSVTDRCYQKTFDFPPWRKLRLLDKEEALGLAKFAGDLKFNETESQMDLAVESISACRDSLHILECGGGKSFCLWALSGYSFAVNLVTSGLDSAGREDKLSKKLKKCGCIGKTTELAKQILLDPSVLKLLAFAEKDSDPPPPSLITIVIVPTNVLADGLEKDIGGLHVARGKAVKANVFEDYAAMVDSDSVVDSICIMTASLATTVKVMLKLEVWCKKGLVSQIIVDEAHGFVQDLDWRHNLVKLRCMQRYSVPLVGLTGTLQKCLVRALNTVLFSRVGRHSVENELACHSVLCNQSIDENARKELIRTWKERKGLFRSPCTVPQHVSHSVLQLPPKSHLNSSLFKKIAKFISLGVRKKEFSVVQVIVPTRASVDMAKKELRCFFNDADIVTLVGGTSTNEYVAKWLTGQVQIAVVTTVGIVGLNNRKCDAVIHVGTYFGTQAYVQAALRAGRAGQSSKSIFFHSASLWQNESAVLKDNFKIEACMAAGINVSDTLVRTALSSKSIKEFAEMTSCRRRFLEQEMDGCVSSREPAICCDFCSDELSTLKTIWVSITGEISGETTGDDEFDVFDDEDLEGIDLGDPSQDSSAPKIPAQQSLVNETALNFEALAAFVEQRDKRCCHWHIHDYEHTTPSDELWSSPRRKCDKHKRCLEDWRTFSTFRFKAPCFKCGDEKNCCRAPCGKKCFFGRIGDLTRESSIVTSLAACPRCGFKNHNGQHECGKDMAWNLVIWAFRSYNGYKLVKASYDAAVDRPQRAFPARSPTSNEYKMDKAKKEEAKTKWVQALSWMQASLINNEAFWHAVKEAVKIRKEQINRYK